jgi:phosphoribosylformylglycinamidine cyclo-ligase
MLRTFNCGIGLVAVVAPEDADACMDAFAGAGEDARIVGSLVTGSGDASVKYVGRGLFA